MIVRKEEAWVFDADQRTTLCRFVKRAGVISLQALAQFTGCVEQEVMKLLSDRDSEEQLEWLRPLVATDRPEAIFCRWRNPQDRQYTWEQDYFEGHRRAGQSGRRATITRKDA